MKTIERILRIIAPYNCLVCHEEGSLVCASCQLDACHPVPSRCYRCKKLTNDFSVCFGCRRESRLVHVWVRTEYGGTAKELIHYLKFQSSRDAAAVIADLMVDTVPLLPTDVRVVGIPTASSRRRQRGYDHAERIARELSMRLSLRHEKPLTRLGQTRQVGTGRSDRQKQLEDAFYVRQDVSGESFLLVDDVTTTGATLESAAAALRSAGAKKVYAVTFAQKI